MNKLVCFDTPKENLKINMVFQCDKVLEELKSKSDQNACLPDICQYYTDIYFPKACETRPYTFSSIVLSSDGKMAYEDHAQGPLIAKNNFLDPDGGLGDFWVLNVLRSLSDGVICGARTLQTEAQITCHVYDNALANQRKDVLKKKHAPACVVVSFDGTDIPFEHVTFHIDPTEKYQMLIATSPDGFDYIQKNSPLKHRVIGPFQSMEEVDKYDFEPLYQDFELVPIIVTGNENVPNTELMLYALKKMGMEKLCIESPTYCSHLIDAGMLDEYFINYSMVFAGGKITPGYSVPQGGLDHPHADLVTLGVHQSNFIFTRQKLRYGITNKVDLSSYKY